MKSIVFAAPHTNISGGVKAICTLAQMSSAHYNTSVVFNSLGDPQLSWLTDKIPPFNFMRVQRGGPAPYRNASCIIEFMDNNIDDNVQVPRILFMQGFTDTNKEHINLRFPFKAVIATSKWLADLAIKYGHKDVVIIPPGVQDMFLNCGEKPVNDLHIVGSLFHRFALKNSTTFIYWAEKIAREKQLPLNLLLLSAVQSFSPLKLKCEWYVAPRQELLPDIYRRCSMWVSPSLREGFGLTTIEAMACGVPTIWVRSGGLDDYMVHEENCLIVEQGKIQDIGTSIERLILDKDLAKKLSVNGQAMAKQFTWEKCFRRFKEIIDKVI